MAKRLSAKDRTYASYNPQWVPDWEAGKEDSSSTSAQPAAASSSIAINNKNSHVVNPQPWRWCYCLSTHLCHSQSCLFLLEKICPIMARDQDLMPSEIKEADLVKASCVDHQQEHNMQQEDHMGSRTGEQEWESMPDIKEDHHGYSQRFTEEE